MSHIFISHVERDAAIMQRIADGLEAAGYTTWYFERDVVHGTSYLIQITEAIEQCRALVLLISPNALASDQVTKEVVGAFERRKPFFPVLVDIKPHELKERQPEWRHALGGTAMITVGPEGISVTIARVIDGLKAQGIEPGGTRPPAVAPKPASYTPKHLADKILAARHDIEGERKQVTVLFADVTGFTSMSEKLDPEEVHGLVRQCLDFLTEEIHRYEGTIAQFLGDGVMALFGAPIAHEDAPQRALYAALAIQQRLRRCADELREEGIEFDMRIGLNTGLVVVGKIGDDLTMEYTAIGDTVNLASRMESMAEPGTIQVAENTYRLTEGYFEFKPLGEVEVKGKKEPVKTYQVLGLGPVRTRLAAAMARGLTPFVGRSRELEHLAECFARAREGQGQVVGIVGEAGVGKSRLLIQLREMLPGEEYTYLEGRCLHYGGSWAYQPLLEMLRSYFDIEEGEREFVVKKRMEKKVVQLEDKLKGILPPLHDILSLKVEDEEYLKLEPQHKRERTFEAIRGLLVRESENRPLILAVEDLHWIDNTSEEFLTYFIGGLPNTHILLIILYRPEYTSPWGSKSCYRQISVDQFSPDTSADMVNAMLEEAEVVPELRELILNRSAGNPLFMEEFTHALVENGSIQRKDGLYVLTTKVSDIQVPDTIQGIIAARMDRLEESLKRTMQLASVIGRDFAFRILQTITGMQEELKSYLLDLQALEFIYEKSLFPELEYIFKHALTQEVAYNSLLLKKRKEIHEKIGEAIEELYPDRLEEFYEMLAHHYSRSENWEKAYQYLKLSGDKAWRSYSTWEAFRFYKEAINILNKLPETDENKRRGIEVRLSMEPSMRGLGHPEDSLEILQEGARLAAELGDYGSVAKFYSTIGICYSFKGDPQGMKYGEYAFEAAEKVQDIELMAPIANDLCTSYIGSGESLKVAEVAPKVIALLERTQREYEYFGSVWNVYSSLLATYGCAMAMLGNFKEGEALCEKALRFARKIDDLVNIGWAEYMYSFLFVLKQEGEKAIEHAEHALRLFEEWGAVLAISIARWAQAMGYYYLGELETARQHAEEIIKLCSDAGITLASSRGYLLLGIVRLDSGDLESAQSCIEEALELAQNNKQKMWEGDARVWLGRTLGIAQPSRGREAEEYILQGIKILEELQLKPYCSHGYSSLGEFYADTGQREKALEHLKKAEAMYKEMGIDRGLRRTQSVLERLQS